MPNFITHKPLDNISTTVSSEFGKRFPPKTGASTQHKGIDFSVPIGTPVYASHPAEVIYKAFGSGWGNFILLRDTITGAGTLYAHFNDYSKIADANGNLRKIEVGDIISGGTQIGLSGNSGTSSGAHLHLEVFDSDAIDKILKENRSPNKDDTRQNPREYLAAAFPNEFATTVKSGTYGIDLTGDSRDNTLIGNSRSNVAKGLSGADTYYFPTLAGSDVIDDADADGKIVIGNGKYSVELSGNALPKTDAAKNVLSDVWTLSGFDLHKIGSDLVIVKAADDVAKDGVGKVTVKNFPFENNRGSFGIMLGKIRDGSDIVDKTFTDPFFPEGWMFPKSDGKGIFGVCYGTDPSTDPISGSEKKVMFIVHLDELGNEIGRQLFDTELSVGQGRVQSSDGKHLLVCFNSQGYLNGDDSTYYTKNGAALVDYSGKIAALQTYASTNSKNSIMRINGGAFLSKEDPDYYYYYYSTKEEPEGHFVIDKINKITLEKEGPSVTYSFSQQGLMYSEYGTPIFTVFDPNFTLTDGAKIVINPSNQYFTADIPKYRDLTPGEITPNQDLTSGSQSTDPSLKKSIVAFQPDVSASLEVSPNPNSCLAVIGCDSNPSAKMSFPVDHHSQISLYSSTDRDYTLDQLLNGEFDFSAATPLPISRPVNRRKLSAEEEDRILTDPRSDPKLVEAIWTRRLGGEKAVDDLLAESKRSLEIANFTNSTNDDYYYGYYSDGTDDDQVDEPEIDLENLKSPYTIISLPNNQTVILVGVNATEVAKTPEVYFLTQSQLTNSPSGQPSNQPIGYPTPHPTAGDLIMPTSRPSGQPSSVPSYKPSEIPSFNPTGKPISSPTSEPSKQSKLPTNQPSQSKDDSDIPTTKPSFNPRSSSPSSAQPSALQTDFSTSYSPSNLRTSEPTSAGSLAPTAKNTIDFSDNSKPSSIVAPLSGGVAALLSILGLGAFYKYCKGVKANKTVRPKDEKDGSFVEIVGKNGDGTKVVGR